ncbi:MAG: hypothetical protein QOK18_3036 [Mycobacterium sp.]|jgi:hypothetical protein|nr:hypothetical protein [Mycobacterium sp.]
MKDFTDDEMNALLPKARPYSVVILRSGPNYAADDAGPIVWEHGRRNFGLRDAGALAIVLRMMDDSDLCGIGIFTVSVDETIAIMADDPGVLAGVFTFEVHPGVGFPGDTLP